MNRIETGYTYQDGGGEWWIIVETPGEEGMGHWAGPFDSREQAVSECTTFGAGVALAEWVTPDGDAMDW